MYDTPVFVHEDVSIVFNLEQNDEEGEFQRMQFTFDSHFAFILYIESGTAPERVEHEYIFIAFALYQNHRPHMEWIPTTNYCTSSRTSYGRVYIIRAST